MAKKQSRKTKKSASKATSAASMLVTGSKDTSSTQTTDDSSAMRSDSQVDWQIYASLIFAAGFIAYFFLFVMAKTADGARLGLYFYFIDNPSIYTTFWTGSANGTIAMLDRWPILLGVSFHLLIAFGIGKVCTQLLDVGRYFGRLELVLIRIGIGLSLISTSTFLLGCLQLYSYKQVCVVPVLVVGLLGLLWRKPHNLNDDSVDGSTPFDNTSDLTKLRSEPGSIHWAWQLLVVVAIPFAFFILLGSMIPPWEYDVREYHLQVPKEWFQSGGVSYMPHNVYGNMPLGTEMHALFAMLYSFGETDWWWGAVIGKTISGCFAILNGMILFSLGKRLGGGFTGVGAALLYLTTPWTIQNSIIGYNESAMACYLLLSVFLMVIWFQGNWDRRQPIQDRGLENHRKSEFGLLLLLGLMIGSSVAAKYTAVIFVAMPVIVLFAAVQGFRQKEYVAVIGRQLLIICVGVLISCGPWLWKNAILTGNPTYPLAESIFPSSRSEKQNEQWKKAHSISGNQVTSTHLQNTINSLLFGNSWLSPLLFPCLILGCLQAARNRTNLFLIGFLVFAFLVWWLATHRLERFLLPVYPIACLMAGVGIGWSKHKAWLATLSLIFLVGSSCNLLISASRIAGDVRIFAPLSALDVGSQSAKDYDDEWVAPLSHLSPATVWLNENHPDAKVLFLGECRPFYARFEVVYNTCFDDCETWKRFSGRSSKEIQGILQNEGIRFFLVNWSELDRLQNTYGYNVNAEPEAFDYLKVIGQLEKSILRKVPNADLPRSIELFEVIH